MRPAIPLLLALLLPLAAAAQNPPPQGAIENVTVEANRIAQEKGIHDYIAHSARPSQFIGKIARWRQPLCPEIQGFLDPIVAAMTQRVRETAAKIGAPVDQKPRCKPNVLVYFTRQPQALMDELVAKRGEDMLGYHFVAQTKVLATITHPIQAWYATGTRDADGRLNLDTSDNPVLEICATNFRDTPPALQAAVAKACGFAVEGNRNTIRDGMRVEMGRVTIIGDSGKLDPYDTDTLADYVTMLALTQVAAFEGCQDMPSITNLLAPDCRATNVTKSLSEVDIAYLRALYHTDPTLSLQVQQSAIEHEMLAAFKQ